jgi:NADH dehydrogenase FAD-containing subunit
LYCSVGQKFVSKSVTPPSRVLILTKNLRQAKVATKNIIFAINGKPDDRKIIFDYKTKGVMALIGKRNGVGILLGHKVHGFTAWWLWVYTI